MFSETLYNIVNTPAKIWPWPHFIFDKIFNDDDYKEIINNLPSEKNLTDITQIHSHPYWYKNRFILNDFDNLPKSQKIFWNNIEKKFTDGQLLKILINKMTPILNDTWGENFIKNEATFYDTFQLTLDKPGYFLVPHTDARTKVFTIICNLATNNQCFEMGTLILDGPHELETVTENRKFKLANQTKYLPNTGVGVIKTHNSWHAVNKTKHDRWTIQYTIWAKPKNDT